MLISKFKLKNYEIILRLKNKGTVRQNIWNIPTTPPRGPGRRASGEWCHVLWCSFVLLQRRLQHRSVRRTNWRDSRR